MTKRLHEYVDRVTIACVKQRLRANYANIHLHGQLRPNVTFLRIPTAFTFLSLHGEIEVVSP